MSKPWIAFLVAAGFAAGQGTGTGVGVLAGGGAFTASGPTLAAGQVGMEACLFCTGRFGLFAEYSHWLVSSAKQGYNPSDMVRRADLAGVGLRIQGRDLIRPFVDFGIIGGWDDHRQAGSGGALGGLVVAVGVRIPVGERWYVRPQIRAYGLSPHTLEGMSPHWAASGLLGIGYSW